MIPIPDGMFGLALIAVSVTILCTFLIRVAVELLPERPPGKHARSEADSWPVSERAYAWTAPPETRVEYCCDQGEIAWPYPCPWHGEHDAQTAVPHYTATQTDAFVATLTDYLATEVGS